jgi:cyclase
MPGGVAFTSKHFRCKCLTDGVYACIHSPGGGAFSNAGIVDLGGRTVVVDAFNTLVAGRDLSRTAEALFVRPVETLVLTHAHSDHWVGASAFDAATTLLASSATREASLKWGAEMIEDAKDPAKWEKWLREEEEQLQGTEDRRVRVGLENSIIRTRYAIAELAEFRPRYADETFEGEVMFKGTSRTTEVRSLGRGHSDDDAVLLLPEDGIAFMGDIGFFGTQPFLGFCDIDLYRRQLLFFQSSDYEVLVPGHGPVGGKNDIALELGYFDVMQDLVERVVQRGGSFEEAMRIRLPAPFDEWLLGGMRRFEINVRYLFDRSGGNPAKKG